MASSCPVFRLANGVPSSITERKSFANQKVASITTLEDDVRQAAECDVAVTLCGLQLTSHYAGLPTCPANKAPTPPGLHHPWRFGDRLVRKVFVSLDFTPDGANVGIRHLLCFSYRSPRPSFHQFRSEVLGQHITAMLIKGLVTLATQIVKFGEVPLRSGCLGIGRDSISWI